jgi:type III secretion system YscQ/HrcQ family protein
MKGEKKPTRARAARAAAEEFAAADPFAADLFAASPGSVTAPLTPDLPELEEAQEPLAVPWHTRLPTFSRSKAQLSAELAELPAELISSMWLLARRVVARFTRLPEDAVEVGWREVREATAAAFEEQTGNAPHIFAGLRLEPGNLPFLLALEASFGISLTDRTLGGPGDEPDSLRNLSTGERAVIEFLVLQILRELDQPGVPYALRLEQLAPAAPGWLNEKEGDFSTGLAVLLRLNTAGSGGLLRAFFPVATARSLAQPAVAGAQNSFQDKLGKLSQVAPEIPFSLLVGRTELNAEELLTLDLGDVVVVEWPLASWSNGQFASPVKIRVGNGNEAHLVGTVTADEARSDLLSLLITEFKAGTAPTLAERLDMEIPLDEEVAPPTEAPADETGEGAALLDAIMLTVHVELAARRVRLDELARLRVNQVLELGCKATDPVDLLVDGRRVARGELVDVEGRLGVRITHLA